MSVTFHFKEEPQSISVEVTWPAFEFVVSIVDTIAARTNRLSVLIHSPCCSAHWDVRQMKDRTWQWACKNCSSQLKTNYSPWFRFTKVAGAWTLLDTEYLEVFLMERNYDVLDACLVRETVIRDLEKIIKILDKDLPLKAGLDESEIKPAFQRLATTSISLM